MRRRPPATVLAYVAVIVAVLVFGFVAEGPAAPVLIACVILGGSALAICLGSRIAWILVVAFHVANLVAVLVAEVAWSTATVMVALLALLLAPPTRRYVRREPSVAASAVLRRGRAVRLTVTVLAGLLLGGVGYAALFAPDPVSGDLALARSERPGLRVLLVGNTLTSDNAMARTIRRLAESDPRAPAIFAVQYARRGSSLADALDDDRLIGLLDDERWSYVVLQDHSQALSRPADREAQALPAATAIDRRARRAGGRTVLFDNPGYEHGDGDVDGDTFEAMQARLTEGHHALASALSATPAPVGAAWVRALSRRPGLDLYSEDGIRPNEAGSYLTACVLYAVLTQRDPTAARYDAELEAGEAQLLRQIARETVRGSS